MGAMKAYHLDVAELRELARRAAQSEDGTERLAELTAAFRECDGRADDYRDPAYVTRLLVAEVVVAYVAALRAKLRPAGVL